MGDIAFELPYDRDDPIIRTRGRARVLTHKGEWLQGPISFIPDGQEQERYTIGVFSLLDDLNSANVEVRKRSLTVSAAGPEYTPEIRIQDNGWNNWQNVRTAVLETWKEFGTKEHCSYDVYGYADIRIGAGSGSSSAVLQAVIRATALEHGRHLSQDELTRLHTRVEAGADPLHIPKPVIFMTRVAGPTKPLGERTPRMRAVTWSAGASIKTADVKFEYDDEALLMWRVRWASLERAVRSGDDVRVARLATASARENQVRLEKVDILLLEDAISQFGALGFSVAHTGTYHTALFPIAVENYIIQSYKNYVSENSKDGRGVKVDDFDTAAAAARRLNDLP